MAEKIVVRSTVVAFFLYTIGTIVGITLCILEGVGTIDIGWFWATFPFWCVLAAWLALTIIVTTIFGITCLRD